MENNKISESISVSLMAKVFTNSSEAILISDAQNRIVAANAAFTKLTGYTAEEVLGKDPKILSSGKTPKEVYQRMWKSLSEQNAWEGELWDKSKAGEIYPKWLSISVIRDQNGQITNYIGSFNNISERKASEERFLRLAYHDALTNLPNRLNLHERLEQIINLSKQNHKKFALLLIDLDRFKAINDTLGHHIGDLLLIEVARRLTISARETDTVARLGGDEFVLVITEIESPAYAANVADKVVQMLSAPYLISDNDLRTSPSIGICIYPDDACEIGMLLKSGDVAMYHAKAKGRGNYQFFTEEMNRVVMKRQAMEADLHLRHGASAVRALLPTPAGFKFGAADRNRGPGALAASDSRTGSSRRIHFGCRRNGFDCPVGKLGFAGSLSATQAMAGGRHDGHTHVGQFECPPVSG